MTAPTVERAAELLARGGVVAAATDTLVGLLALALREDAIAKILALKGPDRRAPLPVLVKDLAGALELVSGLPPYALALASRGWPGPLTLVLRARPGVLPTGVTAGLDSVGVRVPGPSPALELLRALDAPLTGTSANPTGGPPPISTEELDPAIAGAVDLVLPGRCPLGVASTVVDCTGERPRVLRQGTMEVDGAPR